MAKYYDETAFSIELTNVYETKKLWDRLMEDPSIIDTSSENPVDEELGSFQISGNYLKFYSKDFDIEIVKDILKYFITAEKGFPTWFFTFSSSCTEPMPGFFSGGWVKITKDGDIIRRTDSVSDQTVIEKQKQTLLKNLRYLADNVSEEVYYCFIKGVVAANTKSEVELVEKMATPLFDKRYYILS